MHAWNQDKREPDCRVMSPYQYVAYSGRRCGQSEKINFFRTLSAFQNDLNPRYQTSWYIIHPSTATCKPAYSAYGNSLVCPRGLTKKNPEIRLFSYPVQLSAVLFDAWSWNPSLLPSPTNLLASVHPVLSCSCHPIRALPSRRNLTNESEDL